MWFFVNCTERDFHHTYILFYLSSSWFQKESIVFGFNLCSIFAYWGTKVLYWYRTLQRNWSFPLRISLVYLTLMKYFLCSGMNWDWVKSFFTFPVHPTLILPKHFLTHLNLDGINCNYDVVFLMPNKCFHQLCDICLLSWRSHF